MLNILTTAYNCENYIGRCIASIKEQIEDFHCYITNDLSTDNTVEVAKKAIDNDPRFSLIINKEKLYQDGNYDSIIRNNSDINDDDIIVEVDGDDYLPDKEVLSRVLGYYEDEEVWITSGQFMYLNGETGFATFVPTKNLRFTVMRATHLRTWKAWLWREIKEEDLKFEGLYVKSAGDMFFMFPMLEMATEKHCKFIDDINYVYNNENPLGDDKGGNLSTQIAFDRIARQMPPYEAITCR